MKVARFLLAPALLLALAGAAHAQGPQGPMSMDPGSMMPGPMSQGPMHGPMGNAGMMGGGGPMGGQYDGSQMSPDCYPGEMAGGPCYDDCDPRGPFARLRKRTSRGYVQIDAVLLNRNDATGRVLAFDRLNGNPIATAADPYYGFETLPRITAGYTLMNDLAIEGTVFYKDDFDAIYDGFNPIGTTGRLDSNFFPFPIAGVAGNRTSNFLDADLVQLRASTGIHSYELNVVETSHVFNFIAGFRYIEVRDNLSITAVDTSGVVGTSTSRLGTYNHLMGTQFGVKTGYSWELITIDTSAKAGMYINDAQSTTLIRDINNTSTLRNTHLGGQNEAFVGDLNINLTVRVSPSTALRLGYQCMFITQVALAADQIVPLNPGQTGLSQNAGGDLFLHGPSAGFDFRW